MRTLLVFVAMIGILAGCSSIKVVSDYNHDANFGQYTSFQLSPPSELEPGDPILNKLNQQRLRQAVTEQMEMRGYQQTDNADLSVNIYVKITSKAELISPVGGPFFPYTSYYIFYGSWRTYDFWGPGWTTFQANVMEFKEGTLIIDIVDNEKDQLVWQGVAIGSVEDLHHNPQARIDKAVKKIFDQYPYFAGYDRRMVIGN